MSAPQLVEPLSWDTAFWGVEAVRIHAHTPQALDEVERCSGDAGFVWGSLLVGADDLELVHAAIARGYRPVDVRVTLAATIDGAGDAIPLDRLATDADADELGMVARHSLTMSRFYADPRLPDDRCADFYETWIRNSLGGPMADAVIVERADDGIAGFITVRRSGDDGAVLPLVAVRSDLQGRGVGRALMATTRTWLATQGIRRAEVTTQLANRPAIRLYENCGYRLQDAGIWLHRWFDDATAG